MNSHYHSAQTAGQRAITDEKTNVDTIGWAPYFVSALASDKKLISVPMNFYASVIDVLMHVAIWVVAIVFEVLVWLEADKLKAATPSDSRTYPFATASLVCFIVPAAIVILSFLLHNCIPDAKIAPGNFFPFLTAIIEGGLSASIIFTLICMLYTVNVLSASDSWRDYTITLLVMKVTASAFINANVRRALSHTTK